ncbi:nitrite reductase large subunit NirB [Insolitispirillum peregrinum]|uniref:Assimilatory nitrite reductase (NAD(P)H) large subunit n=1 Tax=Insolitispirillum peregrinum TaxID=80876 RepID=A0A1N7IS76_9PROT|nr:nitrite reductase large subunit NirB [Insolitispirillum peregrinum]SIS39943.1 assimilatory nitrite reductase (NAD(P)H) large subunit precursor [Insolitispirillum peregrinum]
MSQPSSQRPHLVVVGNGMAGMRTVEDLLNRAPGQYQITVFGAEPRVNYNRIMLSPLLAGEKCFDEIVINTAEWYRDNDITLISGDPVVAIDRVQKTVTSRDGKTVSYDHLLLATGSQPIVIPVPGHTLPGVVGFRDVEDVEAMLAAASKGGHAVVIGGGLLGLEAAAGLQGRGMQVTIIHLAGHLMERQLDPSAGYLLSSALQQRGLTVLTEANTAEIVGDSHVTAVRLHDGRELPADLVVMAVGIRPQTTLAKDCGLTVNRGIVVDDLMSTSDPAISAVGECVEHRGQCHGLVAPLYEMAKVLADRLAGRDTAGYQPAATSTKLKVTGIDVFSAGDFSGGDGTEDIVFRDAGRGVYKRIVLHGNTIKGAVLYGDTADGGWYFQLLRAGEDVTAHRDTLIFGPAFAGDTSGNPKQAVAALSDDAEICGCNGVCKGTIVSAITEKGLTTLDEVKAHTKASASCGSCAGLVESILVATLGDGYQAADRKPLCGCTSHDHDHVRREIVARGLKSQAAVMQALEWSTPDGCHVCRPALNYYLLCAWPTEYQDHGPSRFINERVHANIQKDGTYSVIPRMWGGLTNPAELRAIADVAEKFSIPTVKVTGGQRIDLLGVRKEDLPAVWADLNAAGMVSGHAYGKSLRTVKTCVGAEWCRFGTQRSMDMGVELEKMTWGSWMPHKFKMAVSGCPRNCAEATIKDFGVVAVDSGWELHVGGNGGIHVRATDLLCKVSTTDEVKEYCGAFVQMYREQARYLERTAPWIERIGLEPVRQAIVEDAENRAALYQRFLHSQSVSQDDPWQARAEGRVDAHEFAPLSPSHPLAAE